jgi:hypothetical protein
MTEETPRGSRRTSGPEAGATEQPASTARERAESTPREERDSPSPLAAEDNSVAAAVNSGLADPGPSSAVTYSDRGVVGLAPAPLSIFEKIARSGVDPVIPEDMEDLVDVERIREIAAAESAKQEAFREEGRVPNSVETPPGGAVGETRETRAENRAETRAETTGR